jgi:hypothetical protein
MITPSSVFSRAERGSRFIEPRNTCFWSTMPFFMCSAPVRWPKMPSLPRFTLSVGLSS